MTKCDRCGRDFDSDALFCPMCGAARAREGGDPLVGTVIADRYLLKQRLGYGGSGNIYLAEHTMLRRKVAVKVLHHELSRDDLAVERFRREATTVGEIDNEHIVEVLDFGRAADGRLFLAMELLEGDTLADAIQRSGRLPVAQVVDVLAQLGEALMEAHAIGYIHRDLRPRNVFLARRRGREGFVKLLDFGLAKLVEREGEAASTSLGMTFGDPRYMSPEQARGDPVDRRADIYSLGVMAYEMLTGQAPFVGQRVFDVLTKHLEEDPTPLTQVRADAPKWLEAIVLRMLAKRPDQRFVTVYRLVEALREGQSTGAIMSDAVARSSPAVLPPPPAPRSRELPPRRESAREAQQDTAVVRAMQAKDIAEAATGGSSSLMGMSGAWYADGEAASAAADDDTVRNQPAAPRKAPAQQAAPERAATSWPDGDGAGESQYDAQDAARRKRIMYIAGGVIAVLLGGVVIIAVMPGGGKQTAAAIVVDAGVPVKQAPPPLPPDAAPVAATRPPDAGPKKPVVTRHVNDDDDGPRTPPIVIGPGPRPDAGLGGQSDPPQNANAVQAEFYVKLGRQALQKGDAVGAAANFNKAREFDARNADAIAGLGEVALQQGYYEDAVVHLDAATRLSPRSPRLQTLLGQAYLGAEKPKQAAAAFKKALKLDPNNDAARKGYDEAVSQGGE